MPNFRNISIKHKLTFITMLTSCAALLLACIAFITYDQVTFRGVMVRDFSILADIFDDNVASGLAFNDPSSIEQTLKTLSANSHILAAAVYDKNGEVVALYKSNAAQPGFQLPPVRGSGSQFGEDRLDTFKNIILAGEDIGTVYIASNLEELRTRFKRYAAIVSIVLAASGLVAFALATKLRNIISQPISHLADVVSVVAADKNYSVRAVKQSEDEMGRLIDGFNEMLNEIRARDEALQEARGNLEKRVEERTKELQAEVAERRRTDEEREKFFAMVENSTDFIAIATMQGDLLYINPAGCKLTGVDNPGEVRLANLASFGESKLSEAISNGRWEGESRARNIKTNKPIDVYVQTFIVKHPQSGAALCLATVQRDISERKQAEEELEKAHQELLNASRLAGMAEVATGVLHNVGNVLNSVNVSTTLLTDKVQQSKITSLNKVCALLRQHASDLGTFFSSNPKGLQVSSYLETLAEHLVNEKNEMLAELDLLRKNVGHIKEIVAMQQNYAQVAGVTETVEISDLVEHALEMNAGALVRHNVKVVREYQAKPILTLEKHKVLQILVNLMRNAKYACDESGRSDKEMKVKIDEDDDQIKITVADNGIGIPVENLTRIFAHGFTTRKGKGGHGFGLHSSALAAKELGGSLTVDSKGPGAGAAFTLDLPREQNRRPSI